MSPVGISRVSNSGQVIYGNPRWMEMSGHGTDEDCVEESLIELVHPEDRQTMVELWQYAVRNTAKVTFELRWGTSDQFLWGMGELVPEIVNEKVLVVRSVLTISIEDLLGC
jgi:PAS domain-containing protein